MSTRTEEKLRKILEDDREKCKRMIEDKWSGIFLYGIVIGIILSYSNFLGYLAGISTGIFISNQTKNIGNKISEKCICYYQNIVDTFKYTHESMRAR